MKLTEREENYIVKKKENIFHVVFAVMLVVFGFFLLQKHTEVENVVVEGCYHYTAADMRDIVERGWFGDNTIMLSFKYKNKAIKDIPFIESVNVDVVSANSVKIYVQEKEVAGFVNYRDSLMYFDRDGVVVECTDVRMQGIPEVTGLKFDRCDLYEKLPVGDDRVFGQILDLAQALRANDLAISRIDVDENEGFSAESGDILIKFGKFDNIDRKVQMAAKLLFDMGVEYPKSGVLHLEDYELGKETFFFT